MKVSPLVLVAFGLVILGLFVAGWQMGERSSESSSDKTSLNQGRSQGIAAKSGFATNSAEEKPAPIPSLVRQLIDPALHLDEQIRAVRNLPSDLSEREFAALVGVIRQPQPENTSLATWSTLVNELMNVLREPRFQWPDYGEEIASVMTDRHLDPVTRDYAAQHLAQWLTRPQEFHPENALEVGLDSFVQLLAGSREAQQSVTGTALLSLCDLRRNRGGATFDAYAGGLETIIHDLAIQERPCSLPNQLAAIQAAGRMEVESTLPAIREFALSKETNASVRLNSVAALGYFGASEDRAFLEKLSRSEDRLRFAAQTALDNQALKSKPL